MVVAPEPSKTGAVASKVTPPALLIVMSNGLVPPTAPAKVVVRVPKIIVNAPPSLLRVEPKLTFPAKELMVVAIEPSKTGAKASKVTPPALCIFRSKGSVCPTPRLNVTAPVPALIVRGVAARLLPSTVPWNLISPAALSAKVLRVEVKPTPGTKNTFPLALPAAVPNVMVPPRVIMVTAPTWMLLRAVAFGPRPALRLMSPTVVLKLLLVRLASITRFAPASSSMVPLSAA